MTSMRPVGTRSSLFSHSTPLFYACYLLKSVQTPQSTAIYIGSTPSPPRRIRQHNGELSQGAKKTSSKRPWIMQMIVYGFPSRLAALQFEWAWQHPHKSRHLCDANGRMFGMRAARLLKKNVTIVRTMISLHPFNTWPLHVKIFTKEVADQWKAADADGRLPLPPGFTCSVELEGVDGQSGQRGSGRKGPISVDDAEFTSEILSKSSKIVDSGRALDCSICHEPIEDFAMEPTKSCLCPSSNCEAVSHLECLSRHFIEEQPEITTMIPRGGHCTSCGEYTLWGDVIRGCYRRLPPTDPSGEHPDVATDDMFVSDDGDKRLIRTPKVKMRARSTSRAKRRKPSKPTGKAAKGSQSSEGESFDFDNISSSSEGDMPTPLKRSPGRPRKIVHVSSPPVTLMSPLTENNATPMPKDRRKRKGKERAIEPTSDIENTSGSIASKPDSWSLSPMKRRPGRPRISSLLPSSVNPSKILSTGTNRKTVASPTSKPRKLTERKSNKASSSRSSLSSSEGEFFDFDNIASSSESEPSYVKRRVGRPPKLLGFPTPRIPPAIATSPKTRLQTPSPRIGARVGSKDRITGTSVTAYAPEIIDLTMLTSSPGSSSSTGKRGRGRPPKSREVISIGETSSDAGLSAGKRPRGRPRKEKATYSSPSSSPSKSPSPVEKRGQGRPRKNSNSASSSDDISVIENVESPQRTVPNFSSNKRSRGRPRKSIIEPANGTSNSDSNTSVSKQGRGRPRKNALQSPSAASVSGDRLPSGKRPRGRPRKSPGSSTTSSLISSNLHTSLQQGPILQPSAASGTDNVLPPGKRQRGWPRKSSGPSTTSFLASSNLHISLQQGPILQSPSAASGTANILPAGTRSRGRPRKSSGSSTSSLASSNLHTSLQQGSIPVSKRKYHQSTAISQVSPNASPPLSFKVSLPGQRLEHNLEQAMSSLHITNPSTPFQCRILQRGDIEIIELSD